MLCGMRLIFVFGIFEKILSLKFLVRLIFAPSPRSRGPAGHCHNRALHRRYKVGKKIIAIIWLAARVGTLGGASVILLGQDRNADAEP